MRITLLLQLCIKSSSFLVDDLQELPYWFKAGLSLEILRIFTTLVTKLIFHSLVFIFVAGAYGLKCDCKPGYFGALCEFSTEYLAFLRVETTVP